MGYEVSDLSLLEITYIVHGIYLKNSMRLQNINDALSS